MSNFKFKKVKGNSKYLAWKNWEEGDYVVGEYLRLGTDNYDNPSYALEVLETSLTDINAGDTFTLNSCGSLNNKMEEVEIGQIVRVEYEGTDIVNKPGTKFHNKEYHSVEVEVADKEEMASSDEPDETGL